MPDTTPRLDIPLLLPSQAQKHVTHNEALLMLDMITQLTFTSFEASDPPTAPEAGEVHVVGDPANGDWAGQAGKIARFDGNGWVFIDPQEGFVGYRMDQKRLVMHDGTNWYASPIDRIQSAVRFGLNINANATNPFSARLNSALWTALETSEGGTGSVIQVMNREGAAQDAGLVLQEGFVTRALLGQFGSDALRFAVSQDGVQFRDGLLIDGATGVVSQPNLPRFKGVTNFDNYIAENTWGTIAINTMEYNDQACFDAATNLFTAPVDGTYLFGANILYKRATSSAKSRVQLLVNGTDVMPGSFGENSAGHVNESTTTQMSCMGVLSAGDTVELQYHLRLSDGYAMADHTAFWGMKIG